GMRLASRAMTASVTAVIISLSLRALRGDGGGALQQHAGDPGAVGNGAALVVDRAAGGGASPGGGIERGIVELRADQRLCRILDQQHGGGDRAERNARGGADALVEREIDAAA